jgi:hypothetical protein
MLKMYFACLHPAAKGGIYPGYSGIPAYAFDRIDICPSKNGKPHA